MTDESPGPATFFGLSRVIEPAQRVALEDFLAMAWTKQYGRPPGSLSADLDRLARIFGADATPKRLREAISALPRLAIHPPSLPQELWMTVDDRRGLMTPEGRVALEQLRILRETGRETITTSEIAVAAEQVANAYGGWRRRWIERNLAGAGLRPGSFGWVILLLINGSVDRSSALRLPSSEQQERQLAGVIMPIIDAFAEQLGRDSQSSREGSRLRSNWRVTQARALLFDIVQREDRDGDAFFWVEPEREAIKTLGRRLASRRGLDIDTLSQALGALVTAFDEGRPALSAFGAAHDRRAHTRYVVRAITEAFASERAEA
jgi:hypothetical protein